MLAAKLAGILAARGVHYGWVIVALIFAYSICTSAAMAIPGILLVPISRDLGWTLGDLSGPLGWRLALFGLIAPFAGGLMLRYGPRAILACSSTLLVIGLIIAVTMDAKWQLWISLGVIFGIAPGMTALVLGTTAATQWFTTRRGLVLGILNGGSATGQLIFLPTAAWLSETYGWRAALVPSVVMVAILAIVFLIFARNHPSDLGLAPYGSDKIVPRPPVPEGNAMALSFAALRLGSGSLVFWVLSFAFFVCGVSSFGLTPHFVPLCNDFGIGAITATSFLALMGICDLIGTIGSGWLSDRYDNRWLLAGYYGFRGLSLIWLPMSDFTLVGLSFFVVFYGLDFIATVPPSVKLTVQAFGKHFAPAVFAWIFAIHQFGAGAMAYAAGQSRDMLASYLPAFFVAGLFCLVAAASMLLLRDRRGPPLAVATTS